MENKKDAAGSTGKVKHSFNCGRVFSRYDMNCPRCVELSKGAAPRKGWFTDRRIEEARTIEAIRAHDFNECARRNVVCTHFEW